MISSVRKSALIILIRHGFSRDTFPFTKGKAIRERSLMKTGKRFFTPIFLLLSMAGRTRSFPPTGVVRFLHNR